MPVNFQTKERSKSVGLKEKKLKFFIKIALACFFITVFIYKDFVASFQQFEVSFYKLTLTMFSASAAIGVFNVSIFHQESQEYLEEHWYDKKLMSKGALSKSLFKLQSTLMIIGLLTSLIIAFRGLCPIWPFC